MHYSKYKNFIFTLSCLFLWPLYSADKLDKCLTDPAQFWMTINPIDTIVRSKNIPQDIPLHITKSNPPSPGTTMYLRAVIQLTTVNFYNHVISAQGAKNNLQKYQKITENALEELKNIPNACCLSYIKIYDDIALIIADRIQCIETLSEKYAQLFSAHLRNGYHIEAQNLLKEKEKNRYFLKKDYAKCQQSLQDYFLKRDIHQNFQSHWYFDHIYITIKKYLFLSISLLKRFI